MLNEVIVMAIDKPKKREDKPKKKVVLIAVLVLIVGLLVIAEKSGLIPSREPKITGAVTGVTLTNPKKSSSGYSVSFDITIKASVTGKLKDSYTMIAVAKEVTGAVDSAKGVAEDGLVSLLGLPSIPTDAIGILSEIASWLKDNAPKCLGDISDQFAGREFKGKYYYSVSKGKGSWYYTDWDYYYATATYTGPGGFNCKQKLGCVFSYHPGKNEFGSCW